VAKLTAARRRKLPRSSFALPKSRSYPIDTKARARNALARAAQGGTRGSYPTVARAVRRKWGNAIPTVGKARGTTARAGYRRQGRSRRR
jgi:hypothetical protein